jgi:hypothetical protein
MEDVLSVYQRPYDARFPQICLDEISKQLLTDVRDPLPGKPGTVRKEDGEYHREGVRNLFLVCEPLTGWRRVQVTERRTKGDWATCVRELIEIHYPDAEKIVLVMDNLNTHTTASLYEAFPPALARRLCEKLEIHYTPKHGSWLNMAEIELSVLSRQCLNRRISSQPELEQQVAAWQQDRNIQAVKVNWRFTTDDARIKLKRLYPSHEL